LDRRLGGPQSRSGHGGEEKNSQPHILWNPKFHYLVHKSPALDVVLSQINSVDSLQFDISKIRFNTILPFMVKFLKFPDFSYFLRQPVPLLHG
jgi:hypothetical protein